MSDAEISLITDKSRRVYQLVNKLAGKKKMHEGTGIRDNTDCLFFEMEKIKERLYGYCKSLFSEDKEVG